MNVFSPADGRVSVAEGVGEPRVWTIASVSLRGR